MMITCRIKLKFIINYLLLMLPHYGAVWPAGHSDQLHARHQPWRPFDGFIAHSPHSHEQLGLHGLVFHNRRMGAPQDQVELNRSGVPRAPAMQLDDNIASHPAWAQLERFECGESAADRIIGGTNAALGQFPWLVRLGYSSPASKDPEWLCGGALITDRHVVTAAHCTVSNDDTYKLTTVRFGEYDIRTDPDCQRGMCAPRVQDRNVKRVFSHPQFKGFHNDVAVVELVSPVLVHDYVSPICLPRNPQNSLLRLGEPLTVAGWGKMNMSTEERAEVLQVVQVPLVAPETCDSFGRRFKMTAAELCAGAQLNKDACGGDSGGPLMKVYDTVEGPKSFLVGVVSFGPTICGIKKPGVYTSVPHFLGWILDHIM